MLDQNKAISSGFETWIVWVLTTAVKSLPQSYVHLPLYSTLHNLMTSCNCDVIQIMTSFILCRHTTYNVMKYIYATYDVIQIMTSYNLWRHAIIWRHATYDVMLRNGSWNDDVIDVGCVKTKFLPLFHQGPHKRHRGVPLIYNINVWTITSVLITISFDCLTSLTKWRHWKRKWSSIG